MPENGSVMRTALLTHPDCLQHEMGPQHPESPDRLRAILNAIEAAGLVGALDLYEAPEATAAQLLRVHTKQYVDSVFEAAPDRGYAYLDPDTSMNPKSLSAALHAAGAAVVATDLVLSRRAANAFCAVRPPGHHATPTRSMGFCIFNNVAIGAAHALDAHGLQRVAILDFDVHHGNGTEDAFHEDPRVLMCSTFQHPYYPYCGADSSNEHILNVPLPALTGSQGFRSAIERVWMPALHAFKPQMVFVSAGFDAHREDPLAYLNLEDGDYVWVTERIREVADAHAGGGIVSTLEGGYNINALGRCVVEHLKVLSR
jgi:acetoin utilization deacetylase AcuC-like enzyme